MAAALRFGMIGTGWMANAIAGDFAICEGVTLAAVGGRNLETGRRFAAEHGIPAALGIDELLRSDVDVVYVATTHDSHAELALAAIAAGKHVLVEKAFTTTLAEATAVVSAAREAGVFLMEAMWTRFNPSVRGVLDRIAEGAIGEPRTVQASFGFPVPRDAGHRLWDPARGGGSLLDQGVYPLTLAQLVLGEPATVAVTGRYDSGVDAELAMLLGYDDGRQAVLATSLTTLLPLRGFIGGTAGMFELGPAFWADTTATLHRPDPAAASETVTSPKEGNGYVPMLRAVADAIGSGLVEHPLCTWDDTLTLMRTVDRVRAALPSR